jgi:hypothetical protein
MAAKVLCSNHSLKNPVGLLGRVTVKQSVQLVALPPIGDVKVLVDEPVDPEECVKFSVTAGPKLSMYVALYKWVSPTLCPAIDRIDTIIAPPRAKKAKKLIAAHPMRMRVFPVFLLVVNLSSYGIGHSKWKRLSAVKNVRIASYTVKSKVTATQKVPRAPMTASMIRNLTPEFISPALV